ncbi:MAG: UPF0147 family protein [Nanoarchaeota archaeon]|nr:UPF0147 family protein [Nanoarchaeota archaeon]MBU1030777.1 UPF0147 family protein [Nanoarchaeota archaeon]MBU1850509.1 UPF0147 family protein [Nanoarchaeota archaeon]
MSEVEEVIETLNELNEDSSVPKNIKNKLLGIIAELKSDKDLCLKINKSLSELDEISEDANLPSFIRTQLFGLASLLETLH